MSATFVRAAIALVLVSFATSCAGPASPVDPGPGGSNPPGNTPPDPEVTISASSLSLGLALAEASVELRNVGSEALAWTYVASVPWVAAIPGAGSLAAGGSITVRVRVDRAGLAPGAHAGFVRFLVGGETLEVDISIEVPTVPPLAEVFPATLSLGQDDLSGFIDVVNAGEGPLHWTWSAPTWVQIQAASGTTEAGSATRVTVTPDRGGLSSGTHNATLTLDSDGGTQTVALSVVVVAPAQLFVSPTQVSFGNSGTSAIVALANRGGRPLDWTASDDADWLDLGSDSGTIAPGGATGLALAAQRGGLAPGTYSATLSIASNGGSKSIPLSLTVPSPETPPPPLPPPPSGSTALAGRVIDQFGGNGVSGLTIQFAGETVTTDATGAFSVPGSPSSSLRDLRLSGPGIYTRTTFARGSDSQWRVVPSSFNMGAFDDMAREYEPRTIRWVNSPSIYVDTRPHGFVGGAGLAQWISEVQSQAASFVSEWTGGAVNASSVQVGSSPPPDGMPGTIVIHFSEDASIYGSPSTVGLARTFWSGDRSIVSSIVWLRFERFTGASHAGTRRVVLGHELGHALGMGHMDGPTSSIMTPTVAAPSLTSFDHEAGFFLYTRSPGNTTPDTDSATTYRGSLAPARAVGSYEWVCGADDRF